MIKTARDIPCPVCGQPPGKPCTYIKSREYRGAPMRGHHTGRIYAAKDAASAQRQLLGV